MSLGNSNTSKDTEAATANNPEHEEESVELPPVGDTLSACIRLLQTKESLAFSVRDLLVVICSQNDGHFRSKVMEFIIDNIKTCITSDPFSSTMLSALFHVLALILHEDPSAREVASKSGLVKIVVDLLSGWEMGLRDDEKPNVPRWVTACFLSIDRLLQVDPKLTAGLTEFEQPQKKDMNVQPSIVIDENKNKESPSSLGPTSRFLDVNEQKRLLEISCSCIQKQLPSETMHVVLQLCATLTKVHAVAVSFLDIGGLHALLSLPTGSLFSGYNNIAAAIIRHILEDSHTLQQAMELEIRHSLVPATNRHSNSRVTPRNFVQNLSSVICRDPAVFMQAARAVCQIEMVGDRPYVILLKDREKEKGKEKEKASDKDKLPAADGKVTAGYANIVAPGSGHSKLPESNVKTGKLHKKSPQSFTNVIEYMLDLIIIFVPPLKVDDLVDGALGTPPITDMEIDNTAAAKGKGKAIAVSPGESKIANQEDSTSLAKTVFVLKLMTEILLTYASSIHVLLRKDAEISSFRGSSQRGLSANGCGGIFQHILHKFLPYPGFHNKDKKNDGDWKHKLATRANQFLVASSIRSAEGRKRIFSEISSIFNDFVDTSNGCIVPESNMHDYVDLLNDVLAARSPTGSYISAEASVTFIDVGLVQSLSRTLQVLDLDNADSQKIVTGLIKALDLVAKEHVHSADLNFAKGLIPSKFEQNQVDSSFNGGDRFQSLETTSQLDHT